MEAMFLTTALSLKALGVDIQRFVDFKIIQSSINVPHDCDGRDCNVHSHRDFHSLFQVDLNQIVISNKKLSEIFFNRFDAYLH